MGRLFIDDKLCSSLSHASRFLCGGDLAELGSLNANAALLLRRKLQTKGHYR